MIRNPIIPIKEANSKVMLACRSEKLALCKWMVKVWIRKSLWETPPKKGVSISNIHILDRVILLPEIYPKEGTLVQERPSVESCPLPQTCMYNMEGTLTHHLNGISIRQSLWQLYSNLQSIMRQCPDGLLIMISVWMHLEKKTKKDEEE